MNTNETTKTEEKAYGKKTLIQASVVAFVALVIVLLWKAAEVFLLIFAGILLAIFLHALSRWISQKTHLSEKWSLTFVLLALTLIIAGGIWSIAPEVSSQIDRLAERIPQAAEQAQQQVLNMNGSGSFWGRKTSLKRWHRAAQIS